MLVNKGSFLQWDVGPNGDELEHVQWIQPIETCSIENTQIVHLNGSLLELWERDRINRFIRLYKKLQSGKWTISHTDAALKGLWKVPEITSSGFTPNQPEPEGQTPNADDESDVFSINDCRDKSCDCASDCDCSCSSDSNGEDTSASPDCNGDDVSPCDPSRYVIISPGLMEELASVKKLRSLTELDLEELLCFWTDVGTFGEKSLYARLFLTHDMESIDKVFKPDNNGNYLSSSSKIGGHMPVLAAALNLKAEVLASVHQWTSLTRNDPMTVPNLTKLYRHVLLAKILGIKVAALLTALDLFQLPFSSARNTLEICLLWPS